MFPTKFENKSITFGAPILPVKLQASQVFFYNIFFVGLLFFRLFSCIIWNMDKKTLQQILNNQAMIVWDSLCEMYPDLTKFDCPQIALNGRLWRTAGRCHQETNFIELGTKFFYTKKNCDTMVNVILPHEIIHQADYNLFGDSEKICGHGKKWREIMVQYGLDPEPHHNMEISR